MPLISSPASVASAARPGATGDRPVARQAQRAVVPLDARHEVATAALHCRHLDHGLFPRLGPAFTARWHHTFSDVDAGWGGVVVEDDRVVAFLLGALDQRRYVAETLARHRRELALRGLLGLALHPPLAVSFARTRAPRYLRRLTAPAAQGSGTAEPVAVVHAVVTASEWRGRGCGRALLAAFERDVAAAGTTRLSLVTDDVPDGADGFYRRLGWSEITRRPNHDGRAIIEFEHRPTG